MAWVLITSALFLMGFRRAVTYFDTQFGNAPSEISFTPEVIALVISSLMLIGVIKMGRVFREMAKDKVRSIESENRLLDFAAVSADWFWEQDKDLRFTYVSVTNAEVSGLLPEDHYGKTRRETGLLGVSDGDLLAHERVLDEHKPFEDFRFQRENAKGEITHISISGKPVFDADGKFLGYRGSGRDVTAMVKAEEVIRNERDKAEKAVRTKSEFLASMSHELRTPLNAILGFSEMFKLNIYGPLGHPKYQEFAEDIYSTGKHLLAVISDLLDLSRIEAGKQPVIATETDVSEVIKDCIEIVKMDAASKGIHITLSAKNFFPTIHVDSRQLLQIFINLVSNAIKYTETGGSIEISIEHDSLEALAIRIKDNGIGIHPADISRMLEMFERADDVMTRKQQGAGLGLPIAKNLVEINGGTFAIESDVGKGTIVTIMFPCIV